MEFMLFYTIGAVVLYFLSDWLLGRIEIACGQRFEHRSLIFFAIIFALAMGYMSLMNPG